MLTCSYRLSLFYLIQYANHYFPVIAKAKQDDCYQFHSLHYVELSITHNKNIPCHKMYGHILNFNILNLENDFA